MDDPSSRQAVDSYPADNVRPKLSMLGHMLADWVSFDKVWSNLSKIGQTQGNKLPNVGQCWTRIAAYWPDWANIGPKLAQIGQVGPNLGRSSGNFGAIAELACIAGGNFGKSAASDCSTPCPQLSGNFTLSTCFKPKNASAECRPETKNTLDKNKHERGTQRAAARRLARNATRTNASEAQVATRDAHLTTRGAQLNAHGAHRCLTSYS